MIPRIRPIEDLAITYANTINRGEFLLKLIPALSEELKKWENKTFNIRTINALVEAAKLALPGCEAWGNKSTDYSGETCYNLIISPEGKGYNDRVEFSDRFEHGKGHFEAFRSQLERYGNIEATISKARVLWENLEARHAEASALLEKLAPFDDLITL